MNKKILLIITLLSMLCVGQFIFYNFGSPLYRFIEIPDDKVCVKWSNPILDSDGSGSWRYCRKVIDYTDEFNRACYWNYDCSVYSEWRGENLGVPPTCDSMNINYSYWKGGTSRFANVGKPASEEGQ